MVRVYILVGICVVFAFVLGEFRIFGKYEDAHCTLASRLPSSFLKQTAFAGSGRGAAARRRFALAKILREFSTNQISSVLYRKKTKFTWELTTSETDLPPKKVRKQCLSEWRTRLTTGRHRLGRWRGDGPRYRALLPPDTTQVTVLFAGQ